jgi:hypothetical protein
MGRDNQAAMTKSALHICPLAVHTSDYKQGRPIQTSWHNVYRFQTAARHRLGWLRIPLNSQTTRFVVSPTQPAESIDT